MADTLSPKMQAKLVVLKKEARAFLVAFKNLEKGSAEYKENAGKYTAIKNLFSELNLIDLAATPVVTATVTTEAPKTKKEARKARREERKNKRKNKKAAKAKKAEVKEAKRKSQKNDKDGSKQEAQFRFEEVQNIWSARKFDEIRDSYNQYLADAEAFITKAKNYITFAENFTGAHYKDEIEQVKDWLVKAEKFLAIAKNLSGQLENYTKIFGDVISVISELPSTVEDIKGDVITQATQIFAAAKQFIAVADAENGEFDVDTLQEKLEMGQGKLDQLGDLVGVIIKDEDKNNLPDWFDKLQEKYDEILGGNTDLVPGIDLDDKILLQITDLNGKLKDFVAAASDKVEELQLQEKFEMAKKWLEQTGKFVTAITGFAENIKEGDLTGIYEDLKNFRDYIDNKPDPLPGTEVDNKFMDMLSKNSKKAETWLMNTLSGGDEDRKKEIKELLGSIDKLILSGGGIVDHSAQYQEDANKIEIPTIVALTKEQKEALMKEHGFNPNKEYSSLERILGNVSLGAIKTKDSVTSKYKEFLKIGAEASEEFKHAREDYDAAVKAHKDYIKNLQAFGVNLLKGILGGVTSLLNPALGAVVMALGDAVLGDMTALNDKIEGAMPKGFGFISPLISGLVESVLPRFGVEEGLISEDGEAVMKGLADLYSNGITAKYTSVYSLLDSIEQQSEKLRENLIKLDQADGVDQEKLDEINNDILILAQKWKIMGKQVQKKYLDLEKPAVNTKAAYFNASRYLHSAWIIRHPSDGIDIGESMIDQWTKLKIMSESKANWDKGNSFLKGFCSFFGGDPYDFEEEVAKLKKWAYGEQDVLKTQAAWTRVS